MGSKHWPEECMAGLGSHASYTQLVHWQRNVYDRLVHMQTQHLFKVLQVKYLGGFDGAITLAKYSWFPWFPRITSATVLMVSVRMSAGTPLAIRMLHRVSSNPHAFIVFCEDIVS